MAPVLTLWASKVSSLREITRDDVYAVLKQRPGQPGLDLASALRSLFQALKQERLIFRDPTRGITMTAIVRLPVPIPIDRLRGLIDRANGTMANSSSPWSPSTASAATSPQDSSCPTSTFRTERFSSAASWPSTPSTSTSSPTPSPSPGSANADAAGPAAATPTYCSVSRPPS